MKKLFSILLSFTIYSASAQISFKTGNVQLDSDLNTINARASTNFEPFKKELSVSFNVSEKKIDYMRETVKMAPGEIYFALEIARLSSRPIDEVIVVYGKNKSKGWGYIAKEAGIKPGSSEFHQLKDNVSSKKSKGIEKNKGQGKGKAKK